MSPNINDLRNAIRSAVGLPERENPTRFTHEEVARIADAVGGGGEAVTRTGLYKEIRTQMDANGTSGEDERRFTQAELHGLANELDALAPLYR